MGADTGARTHIDCGRACDNKVLAHMAPLTKRVMMAVAIFVPLEALIAPGVIAGDRQHVGM